MKFIVHFAQQRDCPISELPGYQATLQLCLQLGATLPHRPPGAGGGPYFTSNMVHFGPPDPAAYDGGDVVVMPDLTPLGTIMVPIIKAMAQHGVTLYAASIGATPLLGQLSAIDAAADVFVPLVRENADLKREVAATAAQWKATFDQTVHGALMHAVQHAVPELIAKMPVLGEVDPRGESTPMHLGEVIAHERERQGISSTELGQRCGVTQTSISRLETGEVTTGPARDKAMEILFGPRAKLVEDRLKMARVVEEHGGGSTSVAAVIA